MHANPIKGLNSNSPQYIYESEGGICGSAFNPCRLPLWRIMRDGHIQQSGARTLMLWCAEGEIKFSQFMFC